MLPAKGWCYQRLPLSLPGNLQSFPNVSKCITHDDCDDCNDNRQLGVLFSHCKEVILKNSVVMLQPLPPNSSHSVPY